MLSLLSLLPLLAGAPQAAPAAQDDWTVLGEVQVLGQTDPDGRREPARTVQLKFPSASASVEFDGPGFDYKGGKVLLNEWGNLGGVHWASDRWSEVRSLREKALQNIAAGNSVPWKIRAYIMTRSDLLRQDKNGVYVIQDDVMFEPDISLIFESFVRMEALVEAFTEGAVDVQIDYAIERVPLTKEYRDGAVRFAPEEASFDFYAARFNSGDYDSVISMYTLAEAEATEAGITRGKTNGAVQSTVLYSNGREKGTNLWHTRQLLEEFLESVRVSAFDWGYGADYNPLLPSPSSAEQNGYQGNAFGWLKAYASSVATPAIWQKVRNRIAPDYSAAYTLLKPYTGQLKRWSEVSSDPWGSLPMLTAGDIAAKIGADTLQIQERGASILLKPEGGVYRTPMKTSIDLRDAMLNNQMNLEREGISRIGYQDRDLLLIRWDLADFVISNLGDHPAGSVSPANVLGILKVGERPFIVVDTKLSNDTLAEANLIGNGITVLTRGVVETGDKVAVRFASDKPDARFSVVSVDGTGLTVSNGELQVSTQPPGTRVYKAIAAMPSGERIERPFVVRVVDPVSIDEFRYSQGNLTATMTNHGPERAVTTELQLPAGWTSRQSLPNSIGAFQTYSISLNVDFPNGLLGTGGATLSITPAGRPGITARTALASSSSVDLVHNTFEGGAEGWNIARDDGGNYAAEAVQDAERGNVLAVRDGGGVRFGRVTAFGRVLEDGRSDPDFAGYSVEDFPYLNFMLKSDGKAPLALRLMVNGRPFIVPITSEPELNRNTNAFIDRVKFVPDGTWQQVSYNLGAALPASENRRFVTEITLGDSRVVAQNHYRSERVNTHWIDDFKISRGAAPGAVTVDPDAELEPVGDLNSSDSYLKALGAAQATGTPEEMVRLRAMLTEEDNLVEANAAAALGRIKDSGSVSALVAAARAERVPYPALMMVRALAFQDTPETWAVMKEIVRQGRAEEMSIAEAARLMAQRQDPAFIEDLSILITGRQWITRAAGAAALGQIGTDPASMMQLAFLLEVDPMVRMAVARGARPDVDLVARRMEWASVNDLSNTVRAHSYAALTKATDSLKRSRGYAGLKEEDPEIRRIIADSISRWPMESHVTPLLGLLSDPVPSVRAAALGSLFAMPFTRTFSEMSVLAGENDDIVIYHLLDAARQKKIELPRSMLERLATHRNPLIRDRVKDLM